MINNGVNIPLFDAQWLKEGHSLTISTITRLSKMSKYINTKFKELI